MPCPPRPRLSEVTPRPLVCITSLYTKRVQRLNAHAHFDLCKFKKGGLVNVDQVCGKKMSSEVYIDPRLECDAPTFVDFTNITSQYDDNADEWFGELCLKPSYCSVVAS